jgi:hypothetical protein
MFCKTLKTYKLDLGKCFSIQICEVGEVGDHPQEDLAKFGYMSEGG